MKKARKVLLAFLVLLTIIFGTVACTIDSNNSDNSIDSNNSDNSGEQSKEQSNTKPLLPGSSLRLMYAGEDGYTWNKTELTSMLASLGIRYSEDASEENLPVLIIGEADHPLYRLAHRRLLETLDRKDEFAAYAIYSSNEGVAVAYTSPLALDDALDKLFDIAGNTGITESGVLAHDEFDIDVRIDEMREEYREEALAALGVKYGTDISNAISNLYNLYDSEWYIWLANLYDPITGGFYFSNSARNSIGFLPDLESTIQVLDTISWSGAFSHYESTHSDYKAYDTFINGELRDRLVSYVHSMQDKDGYYYHPQWGKEINSSRRGRDLNWATELLAHFGEQPRYDTPNGYKGTENVSSTATLTKRLRTSTAGAVSYIKPASSSYPEYLRDTGKWYDYIISLDIPNDSYTAGNVIESQASQIIAADRALWVSQGSGRVSSKYDPAYPADGGYIEILFDYLEDIQNPDTGFWQIIGDRDDKDGPIDGLTYESINGLMKLSSCYAKMKQPFPNVEKAAESIITVAKYPEDENDTHVCSIYNPWAAFGYIYKTLDNGTKASIQAMVRESAPEMLSATVEKLKKHMIDGGGFSYFESRPCNNSQAAEVACSAKPESDVNASTIAVMGIAGAVRSAMGIDFVAPYIPADGDRFVDILYSLGEIIKDEPIGLPADSFFESNYPGERSDYDSDELPPKIQVWPETKTPNATIANNNGVIVFTKTWAKDYNSTDSEEYISYDCFSKPAERNSVMILELDMKFSGLEGNAGEFSKFEFYADGVRTYAHIKANSKGQVYFINGTGKAYKFSPYLESDTWYKIRFEFYYQNEGGEMKIYVNNKYAVTLTGLSLGTTTGHSRGFVYVNKGYEGATISMDNVYMGFAEKKYKKESDVKDGTLDPSKGYYQSEVASGNLYDWYDEDSPIPEIQIWPYDKIADATMERYNGGIKFTKKMAVGCTVNPKDNEEYFSLNYSSGHVQSTNSVQIFEADIIFGGLEGMQGFFGKIQFYGGTKRISVDLYVDSCGKIYFADKDGAPIEGTPTLNQDTEYKIRIEFYYGEEDLPVKLFINNKFATTLTNLHTGTASGTNRAFPYLHAGFEGAYMIFSDVFCGYDSIKYKSEAPSGDWDAPIINDNPNTPDTPEEPEEPTPPTVPEEPEIIEKGEFDNSDCLDKENNEDSDGWITNQKEQLPPDTSE